MSDGKKLDFGFAGEVEARPKADKETVRRVAEQAGRAEGFTPRVTAPKPVPAAPAVIMLQVNVKMPQEIRDRFIAAFNQDRLQDRAIRSQGEFFAKIFEFWENRRS